MNPGYVGLAFVAAFFLGLWIFFDVWVTKQRKNWKEVARGVYKCAEYGFETHTSRSGAMVHTTHRYKHPATVIFFNDERTYICDGERIDMPFSEGIEIRVFQNGMGSYRIEAVETRPYHQTPCS